MNRKSDQANSFAGLPGAEIVEQGLKDLRAGIRSEQALIVLVASPRLQRLSVEIPKHSFPRPFEHELYDLMEEKYSEGAYSSYNALLRRMASFARALEREYASARKG